MAVVGLCWGARWGYGRRRYPRLARGGHLVCTLIRSQTGQDLRRVLTHPPRGKSSQYPLAPASRDPRHSITGPRLSRAVRRLIHRMSHSPRAEGRAMVVASLVLNANGEIV
jgi:hypothetical protein